MRSLQGGEHRLTKLGKGFFRDKYYEYLVHVPVIIRGRRRGRNAGAGYERRNWLPVNELGVATRRSGSGSRLRPCWATLPPRSCSSSLTLRGTGWSAPRARSTGTQDRGGDAPAPAHEGPEKDYIVLGISARSHVDAATLRRALERMDAAWQGEEHTAKLSVNAMIGLWARSTRGGC